jgi:hypothetical protein
VDDAAAIVHGSPDKYVLLMNDRLIDGHHFLAKAEKGKVSKSLPVLDLTALRFQPLPATDLAVKGNPNHDALGRFATGGVLLAPDTGGVGGGEPGKLAPDKEPSGASKNEGSLTSEELADFIRDNPESPEALACKAWAIQDFSAINSAPESERSRTFLATIRRIEPYQSGASLYRGERCKSVAVRDETIARMKADGGHVTRKVAESFSKDRDVALREFVGKHGILIQLHKHQGMRDFEPVVKQVAPQFAYQKEVLAAKGQAFVYLGETVEGDIPVLHLAEAQL